MDSRELARKTGKTKKHMEYLLTKKRRASPELARLLEEITGIDRRAWIWPEEFPNPFLSSPKEDQNSEPATAANG